MSFQLTTTIDLTESELSQTYNITRENLDIVIEINDSWGDTPRRSPTLRRRRRHVNYVPDNAVQVIDSPIPVIDSPVQIIDSPVIPVTTTVRQRKKTRISINKEQQAGSKNIDESKIRERSPIARTINCPICLEPLKTQPLLTTKCGHAFCKECLLQAISRNKKCPTCRTSLKSKVAYHPLFLNR